MVKRYAHLSSDLVAAAVRLDSVLSGYMLAAVAEKKKSLTSL